MIFHLSHTDLDGYGAQIITRFYYKDIRFYNANYGKEIDERLSQIIIDMQKQNDKENIILITDLNLTLEQCEAFEKNVLNASCKAKIILLDHHKSGYECANKYKWYLLDDSRSATKIAYDFFASINFHDKSLEFFSDVVNAVDIWLSDDKYFELGKVCLNLIANAKELNRIMFEKENSEYMFYLLDRVQEFFTSNNAHIELENAIHFIKKDFFKNKCDDTLSNLISFKMVELLEKNKNHHTIKYGPYKGILTYNAGNVSVIGNDFLIKNEDYDFFLDVTSRKTASFRSNNKADVSLIAKAIANGGGHPNASGGSFPSFKDSFLFSKVLNQIQNILNSKQEV